MTPEELREKITFNKVDSHRLGISSFTGALLIGHTVTYRESLALPPDIEERIKDRIMHDIYGDWQRRLFKLYRDIYIQAHPSSFQFAEAEKNFLDALNIKIHPNQEHDDT